MAIDSPKNDFAEKHRWLTYADEPDTVYDGSKIMDGSVTTDKLADYAVTTDKIDDESITTDKLADYAVTTDKIDDESITTDKLDDGIITTSKLADEAVTNAKLADSSVTAAKLDGTVLDMFEGNVKAFDTVADMQAATLEAGDICHTNGFHAAGDGGAAFYKVSATGTANGMDVLTLQDSLFAVYIKTDSIINVMSFGVVTGGSINTALSYSGKISIPSGTYELNAEISSDCELFLDDNTILYTTTKQPVIYAENCSVSLHGGIIKSGDSTSRDWMPSATGWTDYHTGIVHFDSCHDCKLDNVYVQYSRHFGAFYITNCTNIVFEFIEAHDCLYSCISIKEYNKNIAVRNCQFYNTRSGGDDEGWWWCYHVITGSDNPVDTEQLMPENIIYENNYCNGSEDSSLDVHGARNVIIRNNTILDVVDAITCYIDNYRHIINTPMDNMIVENNYCKSERQNNPNTTLPHPFVQLGSANDRTQSDITVPGQLIGSYFMYKNCVVRNNYFDSPNSEALLDLKRISRDVKIENNFFYRRNTTTRECRIKFQGCSGLILKNNTLTQTGTSQNGYIKQCTGEYFGNTGFIFSAQNTALGYMKGVDGGSQDTMFAQSCSRYGDIDYNLGLCKSIGIRANTNYSGTKTFTVTVEGNIVNHDTNDFIAGLEFDLTSGGSTTHCRITNLITTQSFRFTTSGSVSDGTYTLTVRDATFSTL